MIRRNIQQRPPDNRSIPECRGEGNAYQTWLPSKNRQVGLPSRLSATVVWPVPDHFCSTWRSLIPKLEDRPLAFCEYRSIDPDDLVEADRVLPDRVGEVYYLRYHPEQRWYWLEHQDLDEVFMFMMYDSAEGDQARCRLSTRDHVLE